MQYRGVVYDVGLRFDGQNLSIDELDYELVRYEMQVISRELHANAIRIEGEDITRLSKCAKLAALHSLTVFFNPWKMHAAIEEARVFYRDAAVTAEELRKQGIDIVFVAGCEYTVFNKGIFPGETFEERGKWLGPEFEKMHSTGQPTKALLEKSTKLNEALKSFVDAIRGEFCGRVTYSAGSWEIVDWDLFDIIGIDHYRRGEPEDKYVQALDKFKVGKPLIVMEFGCCTYRGASTKGDGGFFVLRGVDENGAGIFEDNIIPERSEEEQADYIETQLKLLSGADVTGCFVFVFSFPTFKHGIGAFDLDITSFSLVKYFCDNDSKSQHFPPWETKLSYVRLASAYRSLALKSANE